MASEAIDEDGTPVLLAKRKAGTLHVWCVYCRREHQHGIGGGSGHRVAHCADRDSPYRRSGYVLYVVPQRSQAGYFANLTLVT